MFLSYQKKKRKILSVLKMKESFYQQPSRDSFFTAVKEKKKQHKKRDGQSINSGVLDTFCFTKTAPSSGFAEPE